MKHLKIYIAGLGLLFISGFALVSCEKTFDEKLGTNDSFENVAIVQVYNAMVNSNRNRIFVDGNQVTGNNATINSGGLFPGATGFSVAGGLRSFLVRDTL